MKRIFLHIGTHKTGSTSLQRWLRDHDSFLRRNDYDLYEGWHTCKNHIELYLSAMREERDSFAKQSMKDIAFDEEYARVVRERVRQYVSSSEQANIIFTSEGLSLLRHKDELKSLAEILQSEPAEVTVIVFLRNQYDYLNSYRSQLLRKKGRRPSMDFWSALYVEDDTWLTDYEGLLEVYGAEFGHSNVHVIDYDEQLKLDGNIIPSFLECIGLETDKLERGYFESYRDNQAPSLRKESSWKALVTSLLRDLRINPGAFVSRVRRGQQRAARWFSRNH